MKVMCIKPCSYAVPIKGGGMEGHVIPPGDILPANETRMSVLDCNGHQLCKINSKWFNEHFTIIKEE